MSMRRRALDFYSAMSILPLAILILVFFLPLYHNLKGAFLVEGSLSKRLVLESFSSGYNRKILLFTIRQALLSALFSVLVALPGTYLLSNYRFRTRRLMLSIANLCFVLPSILVVLGFVIFYGNSGILNRLLMKLSGSREPPLKILYSFKAILLAHVFLNFPVALSLITDTWSHLSRNQENAALTMGAGSVRVFLTVTLPRILPTIFSALLLVFLFCFTSFSIILVLGGGPEFTTIEVEIYRLNNIVMSPQKAAALSVYSFTVNFLCLAIYIFFSSNLRNREKVRISRLKSVTSKRTYLAIGLYTAFMLLFFITPLASIIWRSFYSTSPRMGIGYTTRVYRELLGLSASLALASTPKALSNSLVIAALAATFSTIFSLALALWISKSRNGPLFELVAMLPMAISSVTLGLGYSLLRSSLPRSGNGTGLFLVLLAHIVITLPFSIRTLLPVLRSQSGNQLRAAYTLGAGKARACFTVEIPSIASTILKAFIFSFALSIGEVNATLTLAEGKVSTLPLQLYRLINSYNYQGACAVGTLLVLMTLLVFVLCEYLFQESSEG